MGLKVKEFMFGLPGPKLFSFKWGETEYGATLIPFGGYVKFAGVESELQLEEDDEDKDTPAERKYDTQPRWKKAIIMIAGPFMNMVLPVILIAVVLMVQGIQVADNRSVIGEVVKGSPAAEVGLKRGDRVLSIDGQKVDTWQDMVKILKKKPNQQITLIVKRNGDTITLKPTLQEKDGNGFLGVSMNILHKRLLPHQALYHGLMQTLGFIQLIVVSLYNVILHKPGILVKDSAGPVGITAVSAQIAQNNFWDYILFLAFINVNIGILNLFPFPPLDGGRLAILGVEAIKRGPLNKKLVLAINAVGMALLLAFMVFIVFSDIRKLVQGIPFPSGG